MLFSSVSSVFFVAPFFDPVPAAPSAGVRIKISHMNWLMKEEPTHYSFDDLVRDKKTSWTGVRNALAQKHLRGIQKGDRIFFYHTGDEKAVVGIAKAAGPAYVDPGTPPASSMRSTSSR